MTATPTRPLDSFETALLAELRTVVAERATDKVAAPPPTQTRLRKLRRHYVAASFAVAAAAVAAVVLVSGPSSSPAYAVTEDNDGEVHVQVDRIDDDAGLERELREHGVAADVTYLADNHVCAEGRYDDAPSRPDGVAVEFVIGTGGYSVDLGPGAIREGETIVISISRLTDLGPGEADGITGSIGVASGPVAPCRPVLRK